jgi:hypothetical protein
VVEAGWLACRIRREDAERFIEEVRGDDPELAKYLWIEERELEVGARTEPSELGMCPRKQR